MALRQDEQVHRRLRIDVVDRDEAIGAMDVVAVADELAEQAVVTRRGKDPLLGDGRRADADELADRRVDEPRRVVVAVAAAGSVDEHDVLAAELALPAAQRRARARARGARRRAPSSPAAERDRRPR